MGTAADAPRGTVVVVDDDPAVRNSIGFSLSLEGYRVAAFADGAALLDYGGVRDAQCLVVDFRLPGLDGLALIHELRARHVVTPAILITSGPTPAVRARAARAGVPIVEKPLLGNALSESVHAACGTRS